VAIGTVKKSIDAGAYLRSAPKSDCVALGRLPSHNLHNQLHDSLGNCCFGSFVSLTTNSSKSDHDALDLIQRNRVRRPIVQLRRFR
jgi:hypothetical protein